MIAEYTKEDYIFSLEDEIGYVKGLIIDHKKQILLSSKELRECEKYLKEYNDKLKKLKNE